MKIINCEFQEREAHQEGDDCVVRFRLNRLPTGMPTQCTNGVILSHSDPEIFCAFQHQFLETGYRIPQVLSPWDRLVITSFRLLTEEDVKFFTKIIPDVQIYRNARQGYLVNPPIKEYPKKVWIADGYPNLKSIEVIEKKEGERRMQL